MGQKQISPEPGMEDQNSYFFSQDFFRHIVESFEDYAIFIIDTHGMICNWNRGAEQLLGYQAEEVIGRSMASIIAEKKQNDMPLDVLLSIIHTEGKLSKECLFKKKSGHLLWCRNNFSILKNNDQSVGYSVMVQNIHEQKSAKEIASFFDRANKVFTSSIDYNTVLFGIANLCVSALADWAFIDLIQDNKYFIRAEVAHADTDNKKLIEKAKKASLSKGLMASLIRQDASEKKEALFLPHLKETDVCHLFECGKYQNLFKEIAPDSLIAVPLKTSNKIFGVLTLLTAKSGRIYSNDDLVLVKELAGRVALVLENAMLYSQVQQEKDQLNALFVQAPVAISILTGSDYIVKLANPLMCQMWDCEYKDLYNKPLLKSLPFTKAQIFKPLLKEVLLTGTPYIGNSKPVTLMRFGRVVEAYYDMVYQPMYDSQNKINGIIIIAKEVTERVVIQDKLKESVKRFRMLLEAIPQMTWTNLPSGEVNYQNHRWINYTGQSLEQSKKWGWKAVIHPDDLEATMEVYKKALQTGTSYEIENRFRRAEDGVYRWHLTKGVPIRGGKGEITLWVGTATDIHDQKISEEMLRKEALWESEVRMSTLFDQTVVGIALSNIEGRYINVNDQFCRIVGYRREELIALEKLVITHPDDRKLNRELFNRMLQTGQGFIIEKRYIRPDGHYVWVLNSVALIKDSKGNPHSVMTVSQDITHVKKVQSELEQSVVDMNNINIRLNHINSDLENFVYTASHDLKAPILNIEGLMNRLIGQLPQEVLEVGMNQKFVEMIRASVERFKQTVSDLSKVAKIQKEIEEDILQVNLEKIIEEVLLDMETIIHEACVAIEVDITNCKPVSFSSKNMKSIVYNLVSNAIKYRSPDRQPFIRIWCEESVDYQVFIVQDNGLGMDVSDEAKVFGMFRRLHDHVEGSGIGLYIVKKMIENAGGKIKVDSQIGKGSTFKVYFRKEF